MTPCLSSAVRGWMGTRAWSISSSMIQHRKGTMMGDVYSSTSQKPALDSRPFSNCTVIYRLRTT